ncbi:uncharacterized protein LOC9662435 isoform X1 [Selaginella moellendorffii]|uniref:uncharacterized protein LOC9662435 isoform X1 n=1 Tax=Selaginella moellendorffii TaxID=88036 RepID=UPI000D1C7147|nr:uncharacterized protein LOC9662435 isoform X1 [Selaginella moellendorffii]|eukprot:XP_024520057.1 uncharacterized protein LOC9662435 isoform X1 [Selaginella moellendorffii]
MAPEDGSLCMVDRGVSLDSSGGHWVAAATAGDERDVFISWLKGEFAAANAIIDALCQHLQQVVGRPGEYDFVLGSVHQRRYNWNPVLHMQQYYSIADVLFSLQQVAFRKQAPVASGGDSPVQVEGNPSIRSGLKSNKVDAEIESKRSDSPLADEASIASDTTSSVEELKTELPSSNISTAKRSAIADAKKTSSVADESAEKSMSGFEEIDGQKVNVLEGLKVHEGIFDTKEASRLAALVSESHAAKKKNKIEAGGKRSSKAKGKEVIHFGTIPSEISSPVTEETAEPMPAFLESIIDRLVKCQVVPASKRPDSCSISVLEPGDYMPPHKHNNFEQPLFILSLGSQSELAFGRNLKANSSSTDEKYKVGLPAGSVLVLEGNSAQMVQCAVQPLQSTRMLVTFGKMANKSLKAIIGSPTSPSGSPVSPTVAPDASFGNNKPGHNFVHVLAPARGFQSSRTQQGVPAPMVVPVRTAPGQVLQAQQPVIIASVGPFSPVTMVGPGWSTPPPPGITRVPSPGTGVFLPASNGAVLYNSSHRSRSAAHHFDAASDGHHHRKAIAA